MVVGKTGCPKLVFTCKQIQLVHVRLGTLVTSSHLISRVSKFLTRPADRSRVYYIRSEYARSEYANIGLDMWGWD